MADTPDQLDQTAGDGGLLDYLTQLLSPSDAGAASRPDPNEWTRQFLLKQQAAQAAAQQKAQANQQLYQQRSQQTQADPLYQERLKAAQTKNIPQLQPTITDLIRNGYKGDLTSSGPQGRAEQQYFTGNQPGTGYSQKIPVGPGAGPSYDPAYDRTSELPVTLGKNPYTGDWGYNNVGWAGRPGQAQEDTLSPEGTAAWKAQMSATQAQYPDAAMKQQQQIEQRGQGVGGLTPEKADLAGKIATHLKDVPTEARSVLIQNMIPELATAVNNADVLKVTREKKAQWESSPAPPTSIYLDKAGNPYYPTLNSDREEGGVAYGLNTPQGKLASSTPLLLSHVLQTVEEVNKIAPKGKAAFQNLIAAKIREWNGDPAQRAISSLLDPASAMAVGTLYSSGGAPTRGGVRMAEMFRNSFYAPGDSIPAVKEKLSVALGLLQDIAQRQNLHPRFLKEIQDAQKAVTSMGGSTAPQTFNAFPDAARNSGRELRGSDGSRWMSDGQTWKRLQ